MLGNIVGDRAGVISIHSADYFGKCGGGVGGGGCVSDGGANDARKWSLSLSTAAMYSREAGPDLVGPSFETPLSYLSFVPPQALSGLCKCIHVEHVFLIDSWKLALRSHKAER